jgi:hypothetical protein
LLAIARGVTMATIATGAVHSGTHRFFYYYMAMAMAVFAFGAFVPTYWFQLPSGTFVGTPLVHIHAALFSAWTALLISQTWLITHRRYAHHRAWGLAGIALGSAMVVIGLATAIQGLNSRLGTPDAAAGRMFFIVPFTAILLFAGFFTAAIINVNRAEKHKRYIMIATVALLQAAVGRIGFMLTAGIGAGLRPGMRPPAPLAATVLPHIFLEVFLLAGMIYDWRQRGRPHSAWLIGATVMTLSILLRAPIAQTMAWQHFAEWSAHIAG